MKKLFFFRSSSGNTSSSSPSADKQVHLDVPSESELNDKRGDKAKHSFRSPKGLFSKSRKAYEDESTSTSSILRRSHSMSSASFLDDELEQNNISCQNDQSISATSSIKQCEPRRRAITPERQVKAKRFEVAATESAGRLDRLGYFKPHQDSSASSSSSNASTKVLDRYIDGEPQPPQTRLKNNTFQRNATGNGNCGGRLPPRVQYTAPGSPTDRPNSHSFRESKGSRLYFSSRDRVEHGLGHESPRRLAKNVVERLSQNHSLGTQILKDFDRDLPITIEDVYRDRVTECSNPNLDVPCRNSCSMEKAYEDINTVQEEDAVNVEMQRGYKEAEERILLLSEELEQGSFLQYNGFDFQSLIQTIRQLKEEKLSMAVEVSGLLLSRISERERSKKELNLIKSDLESQVRRLGKEKCELQSALEKELDRRSSDWSLKLKKYQLEEQRLRDRVRELAEQNVSLQREVSSLCERETESRRVITDSEQQVGHLTSRIEEVTKDNIDMKEKFSELEKKYLEAEENLSCLKRNFKEKDDACKELEKSISILLRTCSEQEKTIEGLREAFCGEFEKQSIDKFDKQLLKFQMEQMRLTGVELSLRRNVESQKIEIDSLRYENICLLNRLKGYGDEIGALTFKLDKEIWSRIRCLQNQGLPMLKESTHLCSQLLNFIKEEASQLSATKQGSVCRRNGLDGQFVIEADVKVQGFKRGFENLSRSLQTVSSVLQEKSNSVASKEVELCNHGDGSGKLNDLTSEETLRYELKAECLVTSLLREKLYSKESEVEQLHAEVAAAMRGNEILRCEVQNAMDSLSHASHKLKNYEVEMQKKDENMNSLQNELEESMKDATYTRGFVAKISGERDMMLEKVNELKEENRVLNSEVGMLKKKIETLDEDIFVKEGQITILKDSLGTRPFDLLATGDYTDGFLLK